MLRQIFLRPTTQRALQVRTLTTSPILRAKPEDRTGPEGAGTGESYDPKKLTDGISEVEGKGPGEGEAAPTKKPTRSTGIKSEESGDSPKHN